MLMQFSVTNHRSIREQAVISMKANADKTMKDALISPDGRKKLLPVMAIYGANAAGKSNLLHALMLMKEMVCGNYARLLKGEHLPQEPFESNEASDKPTTFEIIFYQDSVKYAYGFSFNHREILSEYLYQWPNGREALIFLRENGRYEFRENIQEQNTLAGRTQDNRLYLTTSNEWNCPQTANAFLWFSANLNCLSVMASSNATTLESIKNGDHEKDRILKEMLNADLGICDITVTGTVEDPVISTVHRMVDTDGNTELLTLKLSQESMGTQRFFSRIGSWVEAMQKGAVLLVDEIEASMHPLLTRHLIEMIQDPSINTNHAQLIFTTHNVGLLDLTLLRRDQIWFAERNYKTMKTEIYALTEFSPRKDENIVKCYLQGRYGALPFI